MLSLGIYNTFEINIKLLFFTYNLAIPFKLAYNLLPFTKIVPFKIEVSSNLNKDLLSVICNKAQESKH